MMKSIHNWIAVVAVLAVTLLGAVAINRTSSERVNTLREQVVGVCQDNNLIRQQANDMQVKNRRLTAALRLTLVVAARENGQSLRDSEQYMQLQQLLGPVQRDSNLAILDCHRELPKP
jgi:hypothetical protein